MYSQIQPHIFHGVILGLDTKNQELLISKSNDIYLQKLQRGEKTDIHFAIIRNKPFLNGEKFPLYFYPTGNGGFGNVQQDSPVEFDVELEYLGNATKYSIKKIKSLGKDSFVLSHF